MPRGETVACTGSLARAVMAVGHARLAEHGEWILNEKRLVPRAGLAEVEDVFAHLGQTPETLIRAVAQIRHILGLAPATGMKADEIVQQ